MIRLLCLILCLLACGSDNTTAVPDAGWENIGTVGQPLLRRTFDVAPSTTSYDLNSADQLSQPGAVGPFLVGLSAWVTSGDVSAGALLFTMNYDDPVGETREVNFTGLTPTLLLSDATSFFATPALWMIRETNTSLWQLNTTLAGSAGTSTVHYEIMLHPTDPTDWSFFSDQ